MQEMKHELACDALKAAMPQLRVQNTNRNQRKEGMLLRGWGWSSGTTAKHFTL